VRATLDDLAFARSPALEQPVGGGLRGGSYRGLALRALEVVPGVRLTGGPDGRGGLRLRVWGPARPAAGRLRLSRGGRLRGRLAGTHVSVSLRGTPAAGLLA
jgi:hypothetical protein